MNLKLEELVVNWNQRPSAHKLVQVKLLVELLNNINANKIEQLKPLNNFKKQAYTSKEDFFYSDRSDPSITVIKNGKEIKLFFNNVMSVAETDTDYIPPATIILQSEQKIVLITTFSDFSNKKLRRRFTGYKYLKGNYEKFYVGSVHTLKDKALLGNNGFKITKINSIKFS